jgi:two-component system sensor histidine kinase KdpD
MAVTEPDRPDPDALLALAARERRGKLKVFLGAAPGVGKTFEMLAEARRRRAGGADVLIGIVETHGRAETQAAVGDLPVLARTQHAYRGQMLDEFDLDAALARRPEILLLDELAHTNAPGARHPKRWQDVDELREAGIEVWTTMNVQHLESLSEPVARITGVRVAETVPDRVLAEADAIELIDIPPAELLERMRQGKVYRADQAERALRGFFREGNLAALRELALRRTAERVDADVSGYMRANRIPGPWPSGARVLALVGGDPGAETVVREARRIADALRARLLALHVERPGGVDDGGQAAAALRLAESLGAEVETLVDMNLPRAITAHARARNVTHIVMGRGRPPFLRRLLGRTLSGTMLSVASDFTLHLVPDPVAGPRQARLPRERPRWIAWIAVPGLVAGATLIGLLLDGIVPDAAMGMIYLVATVAAAVGFGPVAGITAAALSFLAWNFLFLPPRYTLVIASAQDVVGAVVFALVAVLLAFTAGGLGGSVRAARARLLALRRLVEFSRRLGAAGSSGDLVIEIAGQAHRITGLPACVMTTLPPLGPGGEPDLVLRAATPPDSEPDTAGMAAARWAITHARPTGRGTDTLPAGTPWQFRPIGRPGAAIALLGIRLGDAGSGPDSELDRALGALLDQAAVAMERTQLTEEAALSTARAETEALRTALLTSLGHDLRTPLTSIRGALETLRAAGAALPEEQRADLLATAEEETARLSRYLANILDIVRIEHGQIQPRRERIDLADAIETAASRAERSGGRRIARAAPADLPHPMLDPALLDQILANLIENALKFSGPGGQVKVVAVAEPTGIAISVEDDGPGIARADLARIFDPFYRASRSDRTTSGTGLGLAICRGLAQAMGGRITAESPIAPDGRGTRITLRFAS